MASSTTTPEMAPWNSSSGFWSFSTSRPILLPSPRRTLFSPEAFPPQPAKATKKTTATTSHRTVAQSRDTYLRLLDAPTNQGKTDFPPVGGGSDFCGGRFRTPRGPTKLRAFAARTDCDPARKTAFRLRQDTEIRG